MQLGCYSGWLLPWRAAPSPLLHQRLRLANPLVSAAARKSDFLPKSSTFCQCRSSIQLMREPGKRRCLRHCKKGAGPSSPAAVWRVGRVCAALGRWSWLLWSAVTGLQVHFSERWKSRFWASLGALFSIHRFSGSSLFMYAWFQVEYISWKSRWSSSEWQPVTAHVTNCCWLSFTYLFIYFSLACCLQNNCKALLPAS